MNNFTPVTFLFLLFTTITFSQTNNFWQATPTNQIPESNLLSGGTQVNAFNVYQLNATGFKQALLNAPLRSQSSSSSVALSIPHADGSYGVFEMFEVQTLAPALAANYPGIKSYVGRNSTNPAERVSITVTPSGVHTNISSLENSTIIEPMTSNGTYYKVYNSSDALSQPYQCDFEEDVLSQSAQMSAYSYTPFAVDDSTLRTYRMVIATTGEYSNFHVNQAGLSGGTDAEKKAAVLAAMTVSLDRINSIVENDLAIRFQFIPTADNYIFLDASTDPYSDFDPTNNYNSSLLNENTAYLDGAVGNVNYDVGHVFSVYPNSLPGGVAGLGSLCSGNSSKAAGVTTANIPEGELFNMIFAHEIGHQLGATHSYNNSCTGNRSDNTAYETGSGITIMGYAGICPPNVITGSERVDHYHASNIIQMFNHINNNASCGLTTGIANTPPVITPLSDYTIPISTPFVLDVEATDANGDDLTYNWEQYDKEISTQPPLATAVGGPNFRGYKVSTSSVRYFPRMEDVLIGEYEPLWEVLPSVARDLNFIVTVRDNNPLGGQVVQASNTLTVDNTAGPFRVTSQAGVTFNWQAGSAVNITWDVANTDNVSGVNSQIVDIYLSTDGGLTFDTLLADDTPNDGSQSITVPNIITANARVMVRSADNIFFDVNEATIEIANSIISCTIPQALDLVDLQPNSATISWLNATQTIPSNGYSYYLVSDGSVPINSTTPSGNITQGTTSSIFNNLLPNTNYDFYIRANCDNSEISDWSTVLSFTTICDAILAPYTENFDGASWSSGASSDTIDDCWRRNPDNPFDNYGWRVRSSALSGSTGPSTDVSGSGNFVLAHASGFDNYSEAILEMPGIDLSTLSIPNMKFSYHMFGNAMGTLKVQLKEISSSSYTDVFLISGQQQTSSNDSFIQETVDLNAYANQTVNIRFLAIREENSNSDIAIDEVRIEETSECAIVENLSSSNQTFTTFDLSWDTISAALSGYEWVVMADGVAPDATNAVQTGTVGTGVTTAQITGLTAQTDYDVYVRADCDGLGLGDWSDVLEINLDYCDAGASGFDNIHFTKVSFNTIDNTSSFGTNGAGYSDYTNITTNVSKLQGYNLNTTAFFYGSNVRLNAWIDYNQNGVFTDAGEHVVVNVTDTAIQNAGTITIPATANLGNTTMRLRIENIDPSVSGNFTNDTPCGDSYLAEVEDYTLVIEENCLPVENLVATNTTLSSFDLSWDSNPTEVNGYEWVVMADGVAPDTATAIQTGTVTTGITTTQITGLSQSVDYDVYVRADCDGLGLGDWSDVLNINLDYCEAGALLNSNIHFTNVTFNTINNESEIGTNGAGYSDYTNITTNLSKLQGYNLNTTANFYGSNVRLNAWIDYNQNGVFTDAGEHVIVNVTDTAIQNAGIITIPATASIGTTVMRLRVENADPAAPPINNTPCGNSSYAEVEDYTLVIEENCLPVENLVATNTTLSSFDLSWDSNPTEVNGYEWVVMADGVAPDTANAIQTGTVGTGILTAQITGLTAKTDYDVYVRADCDGLGLGDWSDVLEINLDYCDAGASGFDNIHFTNVTFNTINNNDTSTGLNGSGYSDYTSISTNVSKLQGYNLNTSANFYGSNVRLNAWIDYNQNGVFTDAGEHVIVNVTDTAIQNAGTITIPATANLGNTTMRLRIENIDPSVSGNFTNDTPCGDSYLAEVEDYTITIIGDCLAPTNLLASNLTTTTADLNWSTSANEIGGYDYVLFTDGTIPDNTTTETGSVATNEDTVALNGLMSNTNYTAYVRTNCGNGNFSDWSTATSFTTLAPCDAPTNLSVANVTETTADVSWTASATETDGYDYLVQTSGTAAPDASTTPTGNVGTGITTASLTGLTNNSAYNVYVRTKCGIDILSEWSAVLNFNTSAIVSKALNFDGNDRVDTPISLPATYTKEAWVKYTSQGLNLANNIISGNNEQHALWIPNVVGFENFNLRAGHNGDYVAVEDPSPLVQDTWYHVAVTYNAITQDMHLYKNGVLVDSNLNVPNFIGEGNIQLGAFFNANYLGGTIDEVRVWNTVRTATEIQNNINTELAGNESNLIAYYNFKEGIAGADNTALSAPEIEDYVCDNDATMVGFAKTGSTSNWVNATIPVTDIAQLPNSEINVQGGNPLTDISDGSVVFSTVNNTDFGDVSNGSSEVLSYTIQNTVAGSTLTVADIVVSGTNSADFVVSSFTNNTTITGNTTTTFDVTFTPSSLGLRNATITINNDDCDEGVYDYAVQGTGVSSCTAPTNLAATNITNTTATLAWDAEASASNGYEWVLMANGNSPDTVNADFTGPVGMGINTVNLTGLSSNTTYDAYVRSNCGGGILSDWSPVESFTTLAPCDAPTSLSVANVTETTADVSWTASATETGGYDYLVQTSGSAEPNASTTETGSVGTGVLTANLTGLSGNTAYDVYIRTNCGSGVFSDWSAVESFTTNPPQITKALNFDGVDDYVDLSSNPLSSATEFTIEAWYYPTINNRNWSRIIDFGNNTNQYMFLTTSEANTGQPKFVITTGGISNEVVVTAPSALALNTWSHIAVTLTGTTATMYINGAQVAQNSSFTTNPSDLAFTLNNWIGKSQFIADASLQGSLDELRIWNLARTSAEIQANKDTELNGNETGLVTYYTFDEGTAGADNTGLTAPEIKDHVCDNDGTMFGFTKDGATSNWVAGNAVLTEITQAPQAEINVKGNGVSIANGDTTPSISDNTDFGDITIGSNNLLTYTIQNTVAGSSLSVTDIVVSGINNSDFVVSNFTNNTIVAGSANTTFDVTFTPSASGVRNATITINNTDCDEAAYDFAVQGTGLLLCDAPSNLSVANISSTSADLSWDAATNEGGGYDYVLFTDGTLPNSATTPTGSVASGITSLGLTNLFTDTAYSAYVRTNCGGGNLSDWSAALDFQTLPFSNTALDFGELDPTNSENTGDVTVGLVDNIEDFTLEFQFKPDGELNYENIFHTDALNGNQGLRLETSNNFGTGHLYTFGNYGTNTIIPLSGSLNNQWYHIAFVGDKTNGRFKIYLDGNLIVDVTKTTGWPLNFPNLVLGKGFSTSNDRDFNGQMDEFRLWSVALDQSTIQSRKDEVLSGNEADLRIYYNFEEGIANGDNSATGADITTVINQAAGGGFDGTVNGLNRTGNESNWINRYDNYWNGSQDTNWSNANNWSSDIVPLTTESVVIQNVPNQPIINNTTTAEIKDLSLLTGTTLGVEGVLKVNNTLLNDGSILFRSNATDTGQFDEYNDIITGTGEVTVERYIPAKRAFRLLSSPVTTTDFIFENWQESGSTPLIPDGLGTHITGGDASLGFDQNGSGNPSMFIFDNSNSNGTPEQIDDWVPLSNTNASRLRAGEAYLTMVRGDRTIDLTNSLSSPTITTLRARGDLFTGTLSYTLGNATSYLNVNDVDGFYNLIANPYQAVVDYNAVTRTGLTDFIYVWDASVDGANGRGGYVTVELPAGSATEGEPPSPSSSDADQYLAPGMSFFVQNDDTVATTTSITFEEADKATAENQVTVFSTYTNFYINSRLYKSSNLQNGDTESDAIGLRFSDDFTTLGNSEDATKLFNPGENYAIVNNGLRSIDKQQIPTIGHQIDLTILNYQETNYSLTFGIGNKPTGLGVFLEDSYLNTITELNESFVYDFTVDANIPASIAEDRFSLVFDTTILSVDENTFGEGFRLYPNPVNNGQFSIRTPNLSGEVTVELVNMLGQKVMSKNLTIKGNEVNVNAGQLSDGVYIVKLVKDKKTFVTKLIVE